MFDEVVEVLRKSSLPLVGLYIVLSQNNCCTVVESTRVKKSFVYVLFLRDGGLFSTKFLYFFRKVGIYFEENFCVCRTRWNPFAKKKSIFYSTKLVQFTHKISVFISAR